ncbi:MAG: GNAT family N-acetyltransferase, partial [Holophagales bacterium]|nr:GNAT family N-acetyltransferase [Holophagales bacterium]
GRLFLGLPQGQVAEAVIALSEAGFTVHPESELGEGYRLLVARHNGFRIRAHAEGDEEAILQLFTPSFHVARSPEHWRWKFLRNPWGQRRITVAWSPEDELAAHYAGYPVIWRHAPGRGPAEDLESLQVGDTMTHPRYRSVGRGPTSLLLRCVRHFYARYCEEKVAFNFGFNTGNIRKLSLRFVRAQMLDTVAYWRLEAAAFADGGGAYRVRRIGSSELSGGRRVFDRFFERAAPVYGTLVRRNAAWLDWRYLQCPDEPPFLMLAAYRWGRLVAWSVFRRRENRLLWCDALVLPHHARASRDLIAAALAQPAMAGIETVESWFSPRPRWWLTELGGLGFRREPEPHDLAFLFVPHARSDAAEILAGAYYSMGDGDLA